MTERVVITGLGIVSSIGIGVGAFADGLRAGRSGISEIEAFDPKGFPSRMGGEVKGYRPNETPFRLPPSSVGRSSMMSVTATYEALADAGFSLEAISAERCSVVFGTTDGECNVIEQLAERSLNGQGNPGNAFVHFSADNIAANLAAEFNIDGEAVVLSTACAAGNYAIGHAYDQIKAGSADVVICGGADSFSRKTFAGFTRLGAVAAERCRPFDKNRTGIIPGEGAAAFIVESLEHARARGAHIRAEILGYALSCDAKHMVAPDPVSIARCIKTAHGRAGIEAERVDYICAHGTGTPTNDVVESVAIRDVFGEKAPPTSSIKSMIGHTMGAASALAAVACCIALEEGFMPPTINYEEQDPRCDLDCVANESRLAKLGVVQNNGFAFGGNNAVVLFGNAERLAA